MNYWKECISEALDDAGIKATSEQIESIAGWVEGAHENYGMAMGYDVIQNPIESQAQEELRIIKQKQEQHEQWILKTNPCRTCVTSGVVQDGWGRDVTCSDCNGKGRFGY